MIEIVSLVLPFFTVIACGFLGARLISHNGLQGLNLFVQYFALPALLFSSMARGELASRFDSAFVTAYTCTSIVLALLGYTIFRFLFRRERSENGVMALGAVYGNIGYMGIPIIALILGPGASVPAVIALIIDVVVIIPLMSAVVVSASHSNDRLFNTLIKTFLSTARSPIIVAALLGAALSLSGLDLPGAANRFLDILSAAAAPCALFALGASLLGKPMGSSIAPAMAVSLIKLILHPALLYFAMTMVFSVDPEWVKPAVIAASLPVALTVYIIAHQYDTHVTGASTAILLSTLLSLLTIPLILLLLEF